MWVILSSLVIGAFVVAAIYFAVRAAVTARTPQGAVGWVVFLLTAPYLAVPLYLFFGDHRYRGYLIARRQTKSFMAAVRDYAARHAPDADSVRVPLGPLENSAGLPALRGNGAQLLIDGAATFDAIFSAIDEAQSYVLVQFYIIHDDEQGRMLQDRLIAAAQRGVKVYLLIDALGSIKLTTHYCQTLRDVGVEVIDHDSMRGPRFRLQINFRNHRKTVIVDGETGFTGGLNVGNEYMGRDPIFGPWRDTFVRLRGPVVAQLQLIFAEDWHSMTGTLPLDTLNWAPPAAAEDATALIVATGPGDETETGSLLFFSAITAATDRLWIATPYFVPDMDIVTALRHAALRGVDVRILVPDAVDHWMPWLAAYSYFDNIREAGARVFRYQEGFMHQKVILVDDRLAGVGTTNLDNRSLRLNFEVMALFFDRDFARSVSAMLEDDFTRSFEMTEMIGEQPRYIRYGAPVARLFSPLL